jgi:hypothetical protein
MLKLDDLFERNRESFTKENPLFGTIDALAKGFYSKLRFLLSGYLFSLFISYDCFSPVTYRSFTYSFTKLRSLQFQIWEEKENEKD